jgi:serine/threonine-protein kinase
MPLSPGDRVDRFTILGFLGEGGMGGVYRAEDTVLRRTVAVKVLHPTSSSDSGRGTATANLLREARAAAAIDHPNAVAIFDVGEANGLPYIAMELLTGKTLRAILREGGARDIDRTLGWLLDVAGALAAAHQHGVVHRDIKPENVMVRDDGIVKVLDFGIARRTSGPIDPSAPTQADAGGPATGTEEGIVGTPVYMAPEQMRAETLDGRADQFAWGVLAYEMLTGAPPWDPSRGSLQLVAQVLSHDPEPPSARRPEIGTAIDAVVMRALRKRREERFGDMKELIAALEALRAAEPRVTAVPRKEADPLPPARPKSRAAFLIVGGLAIVVATSAAVFLLSSRPRALPAEPPPPRTASTHAPGPPDYGSTMSSSSEALAAYNAGMQSMRDAAEAAAQVSFARATELDPSFGAAHLRSALMLHAIDSPARAAYEKAFLLRTQLGAHDQRLLSMLTVLFHSPPVPADVDRALAALASEPDADSAYVACRVLLVLGHVTQAISACRAASRADDAHAGAKVGEASGLTEQGDTDAAVALYEGCLHSTPSATKCLENLALLEGREGRCADAVTLVRQLITVDPNQPAWSWRLALYLHVTGSAEGRDEALRQYWRRIPESRRKIDEPTTLAWIAAGKGDFALARRRFQDVARVLASEPDEGEHAFLLQDEALLDLETGRPKDALAAVREFEKRRGAWASVQGGGLADPFTIPYLTGDLTRQQFVAARDRWIEAGRGLKADRFLWMGGFVQAAKTEDDAREAIAAMPRFGGLPGAGTRGIDEDYALGAMYARAGEPRLAIPFLRRATASCNGMTSPIEQTRAFAELGKALAATGDVPSACAALGEVRNRWGSGTPSVSVTATDAARTRSALRCDR